MSNFQAFRLNKLKAKMTEAALITVGPRERPKAPETKRPVTTAAKLIRAEVRRKGVNFSVKRLAAAAGIMMSDPASEAPKN